MFADGGGEWRYLKMIGIRRVAGSLKNAVKSLPVNSLSRSCQLRRISESPHQTNYEESLLQRKVFRRRSKRYREEEHLIRIIEKEAYEQSWAEEDVEISRMKLERATLNPTSSSNGREIPGLTHSVCVTFINNYIKKKTVFSIIIKTIRT